MAEISKSLSHFVKRILNSPHIWRRRSVCFANAWQQHLGHHKNIAKRTQNQQRKTCAKRKQKIPATQLFIGQQLKEQSFRYINFKSTHAEQLTFVRSMSTDNKPLKANAVEVRIITSEQHQQVLDFLRVHYYVEEPLTAGSDPPQQDKEDEEFNMSNIEHGTCLMAVANVDDQDKIVGALLAGPKGPDEADHLSQEAALLGPTKWGTILQFISCVERNADIFNRFKVQKVLHVHVIGVDNQIRGKNIGTHMLEELRKLGKSLDYEMISADCTSFYSARLFERMGFKCINTKYYRDYVDQNGKQVFNPKPPHECCKTYAFKL